MFLLHDFTTLMESESITISTSFNYKYNLCDL